MKICYIGDATSGHTKRWAKWFADRGHEVHLISAFPASIDGVTLHLIGNKTKGSPVNFLRKAFQTKQLVKKIKPDILHAHYVFGYGTFGAFAGFHPFIITCWGSDISRDPDRSKFIKSAVKYSLKKADVIHVGDIYAEKRVRDLGIQRVKFFIQALGVDLNSFNPDKYSEELKKELNINKYMVLCARAWKTIYNVDILIKAAPYVLKEIDDVTFVLLRGGPLENQLKKLAKELRVEQNFIFLGKVIVHNEMPKFYASSDVLVKPYSAEKSGGGVGVATMEAMACGTPLLIPEKAYLVKQGKSLNDEPWFCGVTYEYKNPKDLGQKIIQILKDEKMRKEIGKKEREIAKKIGNWDKNMKEFEVLYKQMIERG